MNSPTVGDSDAVHLDAGAERDRERPTRLPEEEPTWPTMAHLADGGLVDTGDMMRDISIIVDARLDECIALALKRNPSLYGVFAVDVMTTPRHGRHAIVAVQFSEADNNVPDPGLLACARAELINLELDDVPGDTFGSTAFVTVQRR